MAISNRHPARSVRRFRCHLVSGRQWRVRRGEFVRRRTRPTCCLARAAHRLHRHIFLGALRRARKTSFRATGRDSQFRGDQFHYLRAFIPADFALRQNRRPASCRRTRKSHSHHLRRHLHHHGACFVLRRDSGSRRRARANTSAPLPARRGRALRLDFSRPAYPPPINHRRHFAHSRPPPHPHQPHRTPTHPRNHLPPPPPPLPTPDSTHSL